MDPPRRTPEFSWKSNEVIRLSDYDVRDFSFVDIYYTTRSVHTRNRTPVTTTSPPVKHRFRSYTPCRPLCPVSPRGLDQIRPTTCPPQRSFFTTHLTLGYLPTLYPPFPPLLSTSVTLVAHSSGFSSSYRSNTRCIDLSSYSHPPQFSRVFNPSGVCLWRPVYV